MIRETWTKELPKDVTYFFFCAAHSDPKDRFQIEKEREEFNDLVIIDEIPDHYQLLLQKAKYLYKYSIENFQFDFLFRLDDDTLVNPFVLIDQVSKWPSKLSFRGFCPNVSWPIDRNPNSVHYEPSFRDCPVPLPFCFGGSFTLSYDLVEWIGSSKLSLRKLTDEDVALGVWLTSVEGARPTHDNKFAWTRKSRFSNDYHYDWDSDPMRYLLLKDVSEEDWISKWEKLVSKSKK